MITPQIFVKCKKIIQKIESAGWVIDIAAGNGDFLLLEKDSTTRHSFETLEECYAYFKGRQYKEQVK